MGWRSGACPIRLARDFWVRPTEGMIRAWCRTLKAQANKERSLLIASITFLDLRHDFAHQARGAGGTLKEIAYYRYVQAMGGEVTIVVALPNQEPVDLALPPKHDPTTPARRRTARAAVPS